METKNLLFDLTSKVGISGFEQSFSQYVKNLFAPFCDIVEIDKLGNVIAVINPNADGKTLMLEAHLDEIGLIVTGIKETGRIHFESIGGIDPAILPASEVTIHGTSEVYGVIGAKPPHLQTKEEEKVQYKLNDLYIDVGMPYEKIKNLIRIGDVISFRAKCLSLMNHVVSSKSIDNRAGIAILIACAKQLKGRSDIGTIVFLASVQEEVGMRGATVGAYSMKPDIAVAIDVTHGITPMVTASEGFPLGSGCAIAVGPNIDTNLANLLIKIAKKNQIPYTIEVCAGDTGTDAWVIQVQAGGIPTGLLSVPLKYMHSHIETADMDDIDHTIDLLCLLAKEDFIC